MASLQERYFDTMMQRAVVRAHLTPDFLDRLERVLSTPEQVTQYVAMLIEKVDQYEHPSGQLMDRIYRMFERVAGAS